MFCTEDTAANQHDTPDSRILLPDLVQRLANNILLQRFLTLFRYGCLDYF